MSLNILLQADFQYTFDMTVKKMEFLYTIRGS